MNCDTAPSEDRSPLFLGTDGEESFGLLRASLELGSGFELFFIGTDSIRVLEEVGRRIEGLSSPHLAIRRMRFCSPADLLGLTERILEPSTGSPGRTAILISGATAGDECRAAWAGTLSRLNERRNTLIRACPHALLLAGPNWLPRLAHDVSPDLWSVRSSVWLFDDAPPVAHHPLSSVDSSTHLWGAMAHELGSGEEYDTLAAALEASPRPAEKATRGRLLRRAAEAWRLQGNTDRAMQSLEAAMALSDELQDDGLRAGTRGQIADLLQARGQLDQALRIRKQEELPVYERLGDVRSRAVTMGKIADILQLRGQLDEALRIRKEEQLPLYEQLGDMRLRAVTMGRIADILQDWNRLDEALRIRKEEELPVYDRIGDVRERAVTMGRIADIFRARGQLDEALRICKEEELPVYERLGDTRERAVCMGRIADIFQDQGKFDEALRIRREDMLPVFDRLGEVRSRAVTMGKVARVLLLLGQVDEAIRVFEGEELPVYFSASR
ncbi:MAG: hypothetical protein HYZ53_06940 [Planctomycetes bacterium]|nr:hypothetical protein [Planctomycetota bacterium]